MGDGTILLLFPSHFRFFCNFKEVIPIFIVFSGWKLPLFLFWVSLNASQHLKPLSQAIKSCLLAVKDLNCLLGKSLGDKFPTIRPPYSSSAEPFGASIPVSFS